MDVEVEEPIAEAALEGAFRIARQKAWRRGYFERLRQRPSVARVLEEAAPYMHHFPA